ncbi:MAG: thiamine pyrophosphate-binding protein [Desulfobacterales bacterium]|nr:thiamine pyrophosphate-binding protein [Desulfobacterales bacterium]
MEMSGGDIILKMFQGQGIENIFCSPGTEWASVWEGLARRYDQGDKSVKYTSCRHENLAVAMALGYTNVTGRLAAVLLHASVGPLQGAIAMRAAYQSRTPMIICAADTSGVNASGQGTDWGGHWLSSLADVGGSVPMFKPYVKWANTITSRETLIDSLYRGCRIARTTPRGPVFLAVSKELTVELFQDPAIPGMSPPAPLPEPGARDLADVAEQLINSKNPIIITEHAGKQPENVHKLVALAELLGIPVFECMSPNFLNFPKTHPLHMGSRPAEALKDADTVLVVGATSPWYPPEAFPRSGTKVIFLDEDPLKEYLPYWGFAVDSMLAGDVGAWLTALVDLIRPRVQAAGQNGRVYKERFEKWRARHDQMVKAGESEAIAARANRPMSAKSFFHTLNSLLPEESVVVEECITHKPFISKYLTRQQAFYKSVGGLGTGLGITAGTKFACQDKPVFFLVGDGTFHYNPILPGLGLCQEYQLPICIMVLNNGGYLAMKQTHHECFPDGCAARNQSSLGFPITPVPDYIKIAEAYDAYGEKIETHDGIEPALGRALEQMAAGRSVILDVVLG